MTIIGALKHGGKVFIGSDSIAVRGGYINDDVGSKVFQIHKNIAIGVAGQAGQLSNLKYKVKPNLSFDDEVFSRKEDLRIALYEKIVLPFMENKGNSESVSCSILVTPEQMFTFDDGGSFFEVKEQFCAVGSGSSEFCGAMFALLDNLPYLDYGGNAEHESQQFMDSALGAAIKFSASCGGDRYVYSFNEEGDLQ